MQNNSPIKGRRISNQIKITGKALKKKTTSEVEIIGPTGRDLDSSVVWHFEFTHQYENLKSHMQQCTVAKSAEKLKKKKSLDRNAAIKKSQQLYKKKKKSQKIKKSVSAERVKSQTIEFSSPEYVRRKKAATFFNDKPSSIQLHRDRLGLSFLNKISTKRVDQILERNRMSSIEHSQHPPHTPEKHRFTHEIKHYMKEKKKFYSQLESIKQQSLMEKRKHIDENLRSLAEIAKRNSLSNSRSPPRDSNKTKPLMLSYVANRKSNKSNVPKSLKEQFKQLEARYKTLKSNSDVISMRESRNYEHEMKEQAAKCIQRWYKGYKIRKIWIKKRDKYRQKLQQQNKLKNQEIQRWDNLKIFLEKLQIKQDMIQLNDLLECLIKYSEFNKENILTNNIEQPQIKLKPPKIIIEKREVFPPQICQILQLREELIKEREKKEKQILKDLLVQERISPRSFGLKEQEIVKWGEKELELLENNKQVIKDGWYKAYETIQKTQKDLRFVQKLGNDNFSKMMPISLSQSNLLKNQLNDLKINVKYLIILLYSYQEQVIVKKIYYNKKKNINNNKIKQYHIIQINQIKHYHHIYKDQKDVPLDMEEQVIQIENTQYVQTHVGFIRQYLEDLKLIVKQQHQKQFLQIINQCIGPTPFEILRFFRLTEEMLEQSLDGGFIHQAVLGLEIFSQKEKVGQEDQYTNEMERIHNKAIFDAFNEALDYYRPFGIKGRPLPWRKMANNRQIIIVEEALDKSGQRVIQWAETLCGILLPQGSQVDNEILPQVREERLEKMLKNEIYETDERWQEFDEEQTEVALELSELVFDHLITEVIQNLTN